MLRLYTRCRYIASCAAVGLREAMASATPRCVRMVSSTSFFARYVDKEGNGCLEHTHQAGNDEVSGALGNGIVERGVGGVILTGLGQALGFIAELFDTDDLVVGRVLGCHACHLRRCHGPLARQRCRFFWMCSSFLEIDEKTTLKSWTVMETLIGLSGLACALVISFFA